MPDLDRTIGALRVGAWRGATGPHRLDPNQVVFWEGVLTRATQSPVWREDLARHCWAPMLLTGDSLRQHLRQEYKDYADLLGSLGLLAREG